MAKKIVVRAVKKKKKSSAAERLELEGLRFMTFVWPIDKANILVARAIAEDIKVGDLALRIILEQLEP